MIREERDDKLTVPGPWQAAVRAAIADLAARLGVPTTRIAATRVEEGGGVDGRALIVWLMARGRTWRYLADPSGAEVEPDPADAGALL